MTLRWTERVLLASGIACLIWWAALTLRATGYQHAQRAVLQQTVPPPDTASEGRVSSARPTVHGSALGSIDVPRLGLSAVIAEGDDEAILTVAVGHLPDTPLPGMPGNTALAGHRDTFFRPLRNIRPNDAVYVSTGSGRFTYRVRETVVVDPQDLWVLEPTDRPTLTLITCYPFSFIGNAPRRFIVRAERIDGSTSNA